MTERDPKFDSPNVVLGRIAWFRRMGDPPAIQDVDWHIEDCQSGRYPERRKKGRPNKYYEHLRIAKMVAREMQIDGNLYRSEEDVAKDVSLSTEEVITICKKHLKHAKELVRQEQIVGTVAHLSETREKNVAADEVASLVDMPAREVLFMYEHWKLNFPDIVEKLATSGHSIPQKK